MKEPINIFEKAAETMKVEENAAFVGNPSSTKFLFLSESIETKVIGRHYPQTDKVNLNISHSLKFYEIPKSPVDFGKIEIFSTSKLTDCISTAAISAHAFILSKKALQVFRQFNLGEHIIHNASILHKGFEYEYGVLHFLNDFHTKLNFKSSKFYVANILGGYEFDIEIFDEEDYENKRQLVKNGHFPNTKEWWSIKLKWGTFEEVNFTDIFSIFSSGTKNYISEQLAQALTVSDITGFKFESVNNIK